MANNKREREQDQAERLLLGSGLLHTGKPFPVGKDLLRGMMWLMKKYPELVIASSSDEGDHRRFVGRRVDLVTVGKFQLFPVVK